MTSGNPAPQDATGAGGTTARASSHGTIAALGPAFVAAIAYVAGVHVRHRRDERRAQKRPKAPEPPAVALQGGVRRPGGRSNCAPDACPDRSQNPTLVLPIVLKSVSRVKRKMATQLWVAILTKRSPAVSYSPTGSPLQYHRR